VVASSPLGGNERGLSRSKKKTFKERQEFAAVEIVIADLEAEKVAIEGALCTGTLTAEELTRQSIRLSALNEELDEKTMRWLELSEIPD
jgi:ATP-binding cassette subfamily F protein uup